MYGENPFDAGTTRRFPSNGGAVASWIPDVPEDGYYAVYVSWDSDSDNDGIPDEEDPDDDGDGKRDEL